MDHNLDNNIKLGLHLHDNLSLSYYFAQSIIDMNLKRDITIDGSLMGIGRTPGNLPIEMLIDYLNENKDTKYELNYILDCIEKYIVSIKGESKWGYDTAYFL